MRWTLFTGTWRLTDADVERDVRNAARDIFDRGDGIVTGGATGVDFYAMDEAMRIDPSASRLRVVLPCALDLFIQDHRDHWCMAPITSETIDALAELLRTIQRANPDAIEAMPYVDITQEHYDLRNIREVEIADSVFAFQVNESTGTQHTIDSARAAGKAIERHEQYRIDEVGV